MRGHRQTKQYYGGLKITTGCYEHYDYCLRYLGAGAGNRLGVIDKTYEHLHYTRFIISDVPFNVGDRIIPFSHRITKENILDYYIIAKSRYERS